MSCASCLFQSASRKSAIFWQTHSPLICMQLHFHEWLTWLSHFQRGGDLLLTVHDARRSFDVASCHRSRAQYKACYLSSTGITLFCFIKLEIVTASKWPSGGSTLAFSLSEALSVRLVHCSTTAIEDQSRRVALVFARLAWALLLLDAA